MRKAFAGLGVAMAMMFSSQEAEAASSADRLLRQKMGTRLLRVQGTMTGEGVCWHAAYDMGAFLSRYRATGDTAYLDAGIKYYDALVGKMHTSPDGYKGWVGPYIYDKKYIADVHIGDAILVNHMLDFSVTVLKHEDDGLRRKYGAKAKSYVELAKKHLIEKYDKRGTWYEDGPYGGYFSWDHYMTPGDLTAWRRLPGRNTNLSLPFNKQNSMGIACLRIYRVTGEKKYHEKARRIFNFMKSRMCLFSDHYIWNYWEPLRPDDIDTSKPNSLKHWVNVHPYRNYQAGEIGEIVEAFHANLTFDEQDIRRIINTNIKVMWDGTNNRWRNSNHAVCAAAIGRAPQVKAPGGKFPKTAGTLWTALAGFDKTVQRLARRSGPVSFKRRHGDLPPAVFPVPFSSNRYFGMVAALPGVVKRGTGTHLVSKSRVSGDIEIALFSEDGRTRVAVTHKGKSSGGTDGREGILIVKWDAKDAKPGAYRVRWTLKGEHREFPVVIK